MRRFQCTSETCAELQWGVVLKAIASCARTPMGVERAGRLPFLDERGEIERQLSWIEEGRALRRADLASPNHDLDDIRALVERLSKAAVLQGLELLSCARVIRAAGRVRAFYKAHRLLAPGLSSIADKIPALGPIGGRIEGMVEPSGALKDSASDALGEHRRRARSLHQQIQSKIKSMIEGTEFDEVLRDDFFSVRNDRYVLPIVSSFRSRVPGIVHNASGSGQTIFVEPEAIIGLGNELSIAQSLVVEEEQRLYAELSADLVDYVAELRDTVERLTRLDVLEASAELSDRLEAVAPEICDQGSIVLPELRHPVLLLQGKSVVGNRVELSPAQRALVVSGPNAGGKTVTLTAVGLCVLLLRAGLPIPGGATCRLPWITGVASVIGDAQDMSRDLSTFSAHLTRLARILDEASQGWLVLIDEIAADTDPTEGAAIAVAILERLVEIKARVGVTTHLDDVKSIAITDKRFVNARMSVDPSSMRPSYELQLGTAGISNALEMAKLLGLPKAVLDRAHAHLREGSQLSVALTELEKERIELRRQRDAWTEQKRSVDTEARRLAEEREALARAVRDAKRSAYAEVEHEFRQARSEISQSIADIQKSQDMRNAQAVQREIESQTDAVRRRVQRSLAEDRAAAESEELSAPVPTSYQVGSRVRLTTLGQVGEILELEGKQAVVAVGALRTRAALGELVLLPPKSRPAREPGKPDREKAVRKVRADSLEHGDGRLDIRGMRADDAERELRQFIDLLVLKGPPTGLVIHGHGSGVLRRLVQEVLRDHADVTGFRSGTRLEGGEGVTVLELT